MKMLFLIIGLSFFILSCGDENSANNSTTPDKPHKIIVNEIIQATKYTYLRAKENGSEIWIAAPSFEAKVGGTYYYEQGFEMNNFEEKEIGKTFEKITFVEHISDQPGKKTDKTASAHSKMKSPHGNMNNMEANKMPIEARKPKLNKQDISVNHSDGEVTIAKLYSEKDNFNGKIIKVRGIVTKINEEIMNRNWIHIQDGTEHQEKFDLTITTQEKAKTGDEIVFEGKISVNKDFGYGYKYEIIMEEAKIK